MQETPHKSSVKGVEGGRTVPGRGNSKHEGLEA